MTDRELLELAAKAVDDGIVFYGECWRAQTGREWNPLLDDGDALRLAVKLRIDFGRFELSSVYTLEQGCKDVRLAIVRAAAEIGRLK